jgi:hypothetical protein
MGIQPVVFGPYIWAAIHLICLGAPKELDSNLKQRYKAFFELLPTVLPCRNCGKHLEENLVKLPIDNYLNTSADLFTWSVKLHNLVNSQLNKKQISEDEARKFWSSAPKCTLVTTIGKSSYIWDVKVLLYYLIAIVIGIIIGYFLKEMCSLSLRNFKK